jgi:hypothetical protein
MKTRTKVWLGAILALAGAATGAQAANPARLNIDVTITAAMSVAVNGAASSTQTVAWSGTPNQQFANDGSSVTVLNDTGILSEKWALSSNGASINTVTVGGSSWTLKGSSTAIGADSFALQAVFGSSRTVPTGCLGTGAATWNDSVTAPLISATPVTYTATTFAAAALNNDGTYQPDVTSGGGNGLIHAGNRRALCWRVIMPDSTSTTETQNVQVTVTAQ